METREMEDHEVRWFVDHTNAQAAMSRTEAHRPWMGVIHGQDFSVLLVATAIMPGPGGLGRMVDGQMITGTLEQRQDVLSRLKAKATAAAEEYRGIAG